MTFLLFLLLFWWWIPCGQVSRQTQAQDSYHDKGREHAEEGEKRTVLSCNIVPLSPPVSLRTVLKLELAFFWET